jgi:hypothetical protein
MKTAGNTLNETVPSRPGGGGARPWVEVSVKELCHTGNIVRLNR